MTDLQVPQPVFTLVLRLQTAPCSVAIGQTTDLCAFVMCLRKIEKQVLDSVKKAEQTNQWMRSDLSSRIKSCTAPHREKRPTPPIRGMSLLKYSFTASPPPDSAAEEVRPQDRALSFVNLPMTESVSPPCLHTASGYLLCLFILVKAT
jgi:hypothetical protein